MRNGSSVPIDRPVRFTDGFFDRLDTLLPNERSVDGTPSATDFLVFDLPPIRDRLARNFEGETLPTVEPSIRVCIGGVLLRYVALFAQLGADGSVEVVWLSLDMS